MDSKKLIILGSENSEHIHVSFSIDAAAPIYVALVKGLELVKIDRENAGLVYQTMKEQKAPPEEIHGVTVEIKLMEEVITNTETFLKELGKIIEELENAPKSKIIIPKPNWNAS